MAKKIEVMLEKMKENLEGNHWVNHLFYCVCAAGKQVCVVRAV